MWNSTINFWHNGVNSQTRTSLELNFLQKCLESFNFGPNFIRWVMTFYKNIQSCVINNGITSNYFAIKRGVRQGDPLSPYLFVVAVEILAIAIRQNSTIKGITIGKKETKFLQYADVGHNGTEFFQTLTRLKLFSSCSMILRSSQV